MNCENLVEQINYKEMIDFSNRKIPCVFCFYILDDSRHASNIRLLNYLCKKYPHVLAYKVSFYSYRKNNRFFSTLESLSIWIYHEGNRIHNINEPSYNKLDPILKQIDNMCSTQMYEEWSRAIMMREKKLKIQATMRSLNYKNEKTKIKGQTKLHCAKSQTYRNELANASRFLSQYQVKSSLHTASNYGNEHNFAQIPNNYNCQFTNSGNFINLNGCVNNFTSSTNSVLTNYQQNINKSKPPFLFSGFNIGKNIGDVNLYYDNIKKYHSKNKLFVRNKNLLTRNQNQAYGESPFISGMPVKKSARLFTPILIQKTKNSNEEVFENDNCKNPRQKIKLNSKRKDEAVFLKNPELVPSMNNKNNYIEYERSLKQPYFIDSSQKREKMVVLSGLDIQTGFHKETDFIPMGNSQFQTRK